MSEPCLSELCRTGAEKNEETLCFRLAVSDVTVQYTEPGVYWTHQNPAITSDLFRIFASITNVFFLARKPMQLASSSTEVTAKL